MEGILTSMDEACICYIPTFKIFFFSKDIVAHELFQLKIPPPTENVNTHLQFLALKDQ